MNISDVAKITGLTSKAIRFYEEKGLVTPPMRSENGYRTVIVAAGRGGKPFGNLFLYHHRNGFKERTAFKNLHNYR